MQGKDPIAALELVDLALELEWEGVFCVCLECVPDKVAQIITEELSIPVIGIGSGPNCDGQALVTQEHVGIFESFVPKFVKQYVNLSGEISQALALFKADVEGYKFPLAAHSFSIKDEDLEHLHRLMRNRSKMSDSRREGSRWGSQR